MLRVTFPIKFRYAVFLLSNIQAGDEGCVKAGDDGRVKVEMTVVLNV